MKIKGKWSIQNIQEKMTNNTNKGDPTYREQKFLKKKYQDKRTNTENYNSRKLSWNRKRFEIIYWKSRAHILNIDRKTDTNIHFSNITGLKKKKDILFFLFSCKTNKWLIKEKN